MIRLRFLAWAVPLALFAGAAYGAPTQMDPKEEPTTTGPLISSNEDYSSAEQPRCGRQETQLGDKIVGVIRACFSFYRFDPARETDSVNDYGVWWVQATLTPKNGGCAKRFKAFLSLPTNVTPHAYTGRDFQAGQPKPGVSMLKVDAAGSAAEVATVQKGFVIIPRTITSSMTEGESTMDLLWRGSTKRKVIALAGGIEGSWATGSAPEIFAYGGSSKILSSC